MKRADCANSMTGLSSLSLLSSQAQDAAWPFALYVALVAIVIATMVGLSWVLGERHDRRTRFGRATGQPFEGGVLPTGNARIRFSSRFYLVAMFFVIFDLEAAFLFAWAVAARELGWLGYGAAATFIVLLAAALGYLWRIGALDFGPESRLARRVQQRGAE